MPARHCVMLPDSASFDLGASLGIPFLTAHRALTVTEDGPDRLGPGALTGRTVLVAGGAGAVGNAAIQLARWSDATVITTISSAAQGPTGRGRRCRSRHQLPPPGRRGRGAQDRSARRQHDRRGVPVANAEIDAAVVAKYGSVAVYADDAASMSLPAASADGAQRPLAVRPRLHRTTAGQGLCGRRRLRRRARRRGARGRRRRSTAAPLHARGGRAGPSRRSRMPSWARSSSTSPTDRLGPADDRPVRPRSSDASGPTRPR